MKDISGKVQTAASAINDIQSGCDAVGAVSSTVEPLLQSLRMFNSIADEIAKVILFISTMYVADLRAKIHPYASVAMSILTFASKVRLFAYPRFCTSLKSAHYR